jgi:aromatic ring-opening dioxygenase LigB subunit
MDPVEISRLMYAAHDKIRLYTTEFEREVCRYKFKHLTEQRAKSDGRKRQLIPTADQINIDKPQINQVLREKYRFDFGGLIPLIVQMEGVVYGSEDIVDRQALDQFGQSVGMMLQELKGIYKALFPEESLEERIKAVSSIPR